MPGFFFIPATSDTVSPDFHRLNAYSYMHWEPVESLRLIGGLAYDYVSFPKNLNSPPVSSDDIDRDQLSPKAGLIWKATKSTTLRAAYARWLGGVSIDQSVRLEPSQIAGFVQSYRSVIPESAAGPTTVPDYETFGLALDQKFPTDTYLGVSAEWLRADATRHAGVFEADERLISPGVSQIFVTPTTTREELDYDERTLAVTLNQLIGPEWALGASYRVSQATLEEEFTGVPPGTTAFGGFVRQRDIEATLHQLRFHALFNHSSGFFAAADSVWTTQNNYGYAPDIPGDDFWQFNVHAGYRFLSRRVETRVSLLNITDRDYRLNPLNLTADLPRERTLALSLRLSF
jgi:hypothetical protein